MLTDIRTVVVFTAFARQIKLTDWMSLASRDEHALGSGKCKF